MSVAVALCGASSMARAGDGELIDTVATTRPRAELSAYLVKAAEAAAQKRSFAKDRDLAAAAGRKGGESSRGGGRTRGPLED